MLDNAVGDGMMAVEGWERARMEGRALSGRLAARLGNGLAAQALGAGRRQRHWPAAISRTGHHSRPSLSHASDIHVLGGWKHRRVHTIQSVSIRLKRHWRLGVGG